MSLRWSEKVLAAFQEKHGRKVVSRADGPPPPHRLLARSSGDSGQPITVVLPGEPRGKGRPRFTRNGHAYTPAKTRAYEWALAQAGKVVMEGGKPLDGPLMVSVTAIMGVPRSWPRSKRDAALVGTLWPTGRPDADNCQKVAFDSLNGICWRDDSQIVRATVEKRYGEEPMLRVEVRAIGVFNAGAAEPAGA